MPTDELFSEDLLLTLKLAFEDTVPRFVLEDFNDPEQCRIIDLWTNVVKDYRGYMAVYRAKQLCKEQSGTCTVQKSATIQTAYGIP